MRGKTHYKLAAIYYILFTIVPVLTFIPFIINPGYISLVGLLVTCIAALMVDADTEHSLINNVNPITEVMGLTEKIMLKIFKLVIGVGLGTLVILNAHSASSILKSIAKGNKTISNNSTIIVYVIAVILIVAGLSSEIFIKKIPGINLIYSIGTETIKGIFLIIKKILIKAIYISGGAALIVHNINSSNNSIPVYLAGVLLILTAIFPHRTFLHSPEGLILFTILAGYVTSYLGYSYLIYPFFIGWFSHIYTADILTNTGVPVSFLPTLIKRLGLYEILNRFKLYRGIMKVLDAKISIPMTSTGTPTGNVIEYIYTLAIFGVTIYVIYKTGINMDNIRII